MVGRRYVPWQMAIALLCYLPICLNGSQAAAQKQMTDDELRRWLQQTSTYEIRGIRFRVPAPYTLDMGQTAITRRDPALLQFQFWISDGKPLWDGAYNAIAARDLIGRPLQDFSGMYWFWPPEPGRPSILSHDDFLVHVLDLGRSPDGIGRQQRLRGITGSRLTSSPIIEQYGSLRCGIDRKNTTFSVICQNPFEEDPAVHISGGGPLHLKEGHLSYLEMNFHSRVDGFDVRLVFPEIGLSRWKEGVCRTLLLIRTWRVGDGPSPEDCSKLPRLSMR